jgi:hypothetical protein
VRYRLDAGSVKPVMRIEMRWRRDEAVFVHDAMADEPRRSTDITEDFRHCAAEAAKHIVFLDSEEALRAMGCRADRFMIQRLDRRHVDEADIAALLAQGAHRLQRRMHHGAAGDDRQIRAFVMDDGLAELEKNRLFIDHWIMPARDAEIDGLRPVAAKNISGTTAAGFLQQRFTEVFAVLSRTNPLLTFHR